MFAAATVPTFEHQSRLPRLPVPSLRQACSLFLETVTPLVSSEQLEEARLVVQDFEQKEGKELQKMAEEAAALPACLSYIEDYWYDMYLTDRGRIAIQSNPFFLFEPDRTSLRSTQVSRAASLIISALKFVSAVRQEKLEPDMWRSVAMCMYQYPRLFSSTRVPQPIRDEDQFYPAARHITILSRGQLYFFDCLSADSELSVTEVTIAENLRVIMEDAARTTDTDVANNAISVLTAASREDWVKTRRRLGEIDTRNEESLHIVDSSLFVVCLDHENGQNSDDVCHHMLHGSSRVVDGLQMGTCLNRWFDKTIQIIVSPDGTAGINFEHSVVDGHSVLRFASDVYTDTILRFAKTIRGDVKELLVGKDGRDVDSAPRKILWRMAGDVRSAIRCAEADFADEIGRVEMKAFEFHEYGKRWIVCNNLSPDAYVQALFQLAYYRVYGKLANTYETVQTKKFRHGRTECARPLTAELAQFVKVFCSEASTEEKANAIHAAVKAHTELVKARSEGIGFERHLGVLRHLANQEGRPMPKLFQSEAWKMLCTNTISTSNCGNPSLRMFGFGPVCANGFGIGYLIKDDAINFCVSSWSRQTARYVECLDRSLREMRDLLESNAAGSFPLSGRGHRSVLPPTSFTITPAASRRSSTFL